MAWLELKLRANADLVDTITTLLTELGALAVTTQDAGDQPIYEPEPGSEKMWDDVIITGLFDDHEDMNTVLRFDLVE